MFVEAMLLSFSMYTRTHLPHIFLLTLLIIFYGACRKDEAGKVSAPDTNNTSRQKASKIELKVTEDEVIPKESEALIRGTVQNISEEKLENIVIELELIPRRGGVNKVRQLPISPGALSPGETGTYSLTVSNHDWSNTKILGIRSSTRSELVGFTTVRGAKRPPERTPPGKVVIVQRPRPKGEEFLNTPDDPETIP